MRPFAHGGDFETAQRALGRSVLDFSANINPLGIPRAVLDAAKDALPSCDRYPDPHCRELTRRLAQHYAVTPAQVLCGSGAADLIFRLALALRPKNALLLAPTFSEYENALTLVGCHTRYHMLRESDGFALTASVLDVPLDGVDLVILCNPNNPTGAAAPRALTEAMLARCEQVGIPLLVDECFVDFLEDPSAYTLADALPAHPKLVILNAFTKFYAMAGLRLGYALSSDEALLDRMAQSGPPWSVSTVAQQAGLAALSPALDEYRRATRATLSQNRRTLIAGLSDLGCRIYGSQANYVFFRAPVADLTDRLYACGVLLRNCGNYVGLDARYCRAAVRTRSENDVLLAVLQRILDPAEDSR